MAEKMKHPKALPFLFFTEMWERFGYYLMIGIFTLFLKDTVDKGGYEMTEADASSLYGTFIALVFLTPFLGGLLADRVLGYRRSITIGGILMGLGYMLMGFQSLPILYLAMTLVIIGNGFFKPNISTLLGNLYNEEKFKPLKDSGYSIFYMGINIGAFICNFFGAAMKNIFNWQAAFATAGIGMFIGIIIFWIGTKHYKHADVLKPVQKEDMSLTRISLLILLPSLVFAVIGYILPITLVKDKSTDAFIFASIPIIYYYITLYTQASNSDKRPIAAMLAIFGVSIAFWAVFKQNGSALNTWADRYTDRSLSENLVAPANALYQTQKVTGDTALYPIYDKQFRAARDEAGKVIKAPGLDPYLLNIAEEQKPKSGESIFLWSTNLSQSINPAWVILLTPVVIGFFNLLRRRKKEPSTPAKIAWGLLISALSTLVMVGAVIYASNGQMKASPMWLIACYGVITIGELFLSPMGLSMVSKLSPPRLTALMMGGWFLSTSIGNKLSGVLATLWDSYDNKANFFWVNFVLLVIAALMMFGILRWLNKIFKEHGV